MKGNKLYITLLGFVLLLLSGACEDDFPSDKQDGQGFVLSLSLATQAATRATEAGVDVFNENRIAQADVYFFPVNAAGQDDEKCLYVQTGLVPSLVSGSSTDYELQVPLDPAIISEGKAYYVYVVANPDAGGMTTGTVGETLADIRQKTLTTDWKSGYGADGVGLKDATLEQVTETALVMDGGKALTIETPQSSPVVIDMTRAMAKVMLYASTESEITAHGITYTAVPSGMFATMVYSVGKTNLAGDYAMQPTDYITRLRRNYEDQYTTTADGKHRYAQMAPFYSYPNPADTEGRQDAYLILSVPWMAREEGSQSYEAHDYYYRVPITGTDAPALLDRNHYYKINVHIGVLGSLSPRDAVEVQAEFEIMDWFEVGIDTDMQQYRYLVLESYYTELNNEMTVDMPYISSSEIAWDKDGQRDPNGNYTHIVSVTFEDYSEDETETVTLDASHPTHTTGSGYNSRTIRFSNFQVEEGPGGTLRFTHPLSDDNDFVPYTITVAVFNQQGVQSKEEWVIRQYPAMYIVGENNDGETNVSGGGINRFVNGYNQETVYSGGFFQTALNPPRDDNRNELGSISELGGNNYNPNLYTIHISSFADNTYAIGDPRSETVYSFGNALDATEYRATRQDAENVIAPAFKVASSWGKTTDISYQTAVKRCASYQEAGYPAGRWRIPTKAEVEYITQLSSDGKIPRLFGGQNGSAAAYWVSSGTYTAGASYTDNYYTPGLSGSEAVRCVYDVWYWGEATIEEDKEHNTGNWDNNDFVWGDNPQGALEKGQEH